MVRTLSTMLQLGTTAPDFALTDTDGNTVSRTDFAGKPLLTMFICNHCPFVKHMREELAAIGTDYQSKGISIVAIMSNDVANYPDDSPEKMKQEKEQFGYSFPYLLDGTQEVAHAYTAACTPDFFLFDGDHQLVYRGQLDDSRPENGTADGSDLRAALDAVLAGQAVSEDQKPSMGCNIKWKSVS